LALNYHVTFILVTYAFYSLGDAPEITPTPRTGKDSSKKGLIGIFFNDENLFMAN
jgi:hypothetical protein